MSNQHKIKYRHNTRTMAVQHAADCTTHVSWAGQWAQYTTRHVDTALIKTALLVTMASAARCGSGHHSHRLTGHLPNRTGPPSVPRRRWLVITVNHRNVTQRNVT